MNWNVKGGYLLNAFDWFLLDAGMNVWFVFEKKELGNEAKSRRKKKRGEAHRKEFHRSFNEWKDVFFCLSCLDWKGSLNWEEKEETPMLFQKKKNELKPKTKTKKYSYLLKFTFITYIYVCIIYRIPLFQFHSQHKWAIQWAKTWTVLLGQ